MYSVGILSRLVVEMLMIGLFIVYDICFDVDSVGFFALTYDCVYSYVLVVRGLDNAFRLAQCMSLSTDLFWSAF